MTNGAMEIVAQGAPPWLAARSKAQRLYAVQATPADRLQTNRR